MERVHEKAVVGMEDLKGFACQLAELLIAKMAELSMAAQCSTTLPSTAAVIKTDLV